MIAKVSVRSYAAAQTSGAQTAGGPNGAYQTPSFESKGLFLFIVVLLLLHHLLGSHTNAFYMSQLYRRSIYIHVYAYTRMYACTYEQYVCITGRLI